MKICPRCELEKLEEDFYKSKETKDGLRFYCKKCDNRINNDRYLVNKEERKIKIKSWANSHKTIRRKYGREFHRRNRLNDRLRKYGLTVDSYNNLLNEQSFKCKICKILFDSKSKRTTPHIDHDHNCCAGNKSCGKCIRGLVCHSCNQILGHSYDNITTLRSAITYLGGEYDAQTG